MSKKIKVLVVDDSALIRNMLNALIGAQDDMEVVGNAEDPYEAREKIKTLNPDVLTLDVEMPKMDGLTFLEKIMTLRPMPVIMVSTLTGKGTDAAIAALQFGAVECIAKPLVHSDAELHIFTRELCDKIRMASIARIRAHRSTNAAPALQFEAMKLSRNAPKLIAIGASTGGVEALTEVLTKLPAKMPPIMITQHMPKGFTASFANRLSTLCQINVIEASDKMKLVAGAALIAPGGLQMEVATDTSGQFICKITDTPPVSGHKPSVDVLFDSVAKLAPANAIGVILTGMGKDGARGLLHMKQAGLHTIGQDEASCVVYGMPKVATEMGALVEVKPLSQISNVLKERCFQ